MLKSRRAWLVLPILMSVGACSRNPLDSVVCPAVASPAITVEVLDSVTLRPAAGGATGWVRDGSYQDSLRVIGWTGPDISAETAIQMAAAYERPGTYTVEISRSGYATWRRERVRAREGVCGVETVQLKALLLPINTLLD